ncbi:hypothetical protein EP47_05765 [Legionella norrlandica]|uniref:Uncharacterized protein n=1 Tax=Legionella norrlandica TaxID=1498499 RepID=A0A0A2SQV3_9GAMM|nr:hypothetical protein [Legionella norrlandica]KGP63490.1 hypothetical protein EP47_05765 [Legionella norrlandica]
MKYTDVDEIFIQAFKNQFLSHLMADVQKDGPQNQAKKVVQDAISDNIGKLSRIFDAMVLPIENSETFFKNLAQAGSMENYMRPILNAITPILLTPDKSRLQSEVIDAIGKDNYAQLVGGLVKDGLVIPKDGDEVGFAQKEAEVARLVVSSVLVNYSQSLEKYNLSPEEKLLREKSSDLLFANIKQLKEVASNAGYAIPTKIEPTRFSNIDELNKEADRLILLSKEALNDEDSDLGGVLKQCMAFYENYKQYMDASLNDFGQKVTLPLQAMATKFTLQMLEEPKPKMSVKEISDRVEKLFSLADRLSAFLEKKYPDSYASDPVYNSLKTLKNRLQEARDIPELYQGDDLIREQMHNKYTDALNIFIEKVEADVIPSEPPPSKMNILLRILRAIFTLSFSLTTKEEREAQKRFEDCSTLRNDLTQLKSELESQSLAHQENPQKDSTNSQIALEQQSEIKKSLADIRESTKSEMAIERDNSSTVTNSF